MQGQVFVGHSRQWYRQTRLYMSSESSTISHLPWEFYYSMYLCSMCLICPTRLLPVAIRVGDNSGGLVNFTTMWLCQFRYKLMAWWLWICLSSKQVRLKNINRNRIIGPIGWRCLRENENKPTTEFSIRRFNRLHAFSPVTFWLFSQRNYRVMELW